MFLVHLSFLELLSSFQRLLFSGCNTAFCLASLLFGCRLSLTFFYVNAYRRRMLVNSASLFWCLQRIFGIFQSRKLLLAFTSTASNSCSIVACVSVAAGVYLPNLSLAMVVSFFCSNLLAFSPHVTLFWDLHPVMQITAQKYHSSSNM